MSAVGLACSLGFWPWAPNAFEARAQTVDPPRRSSSRALDWATRAANALGGVDKLKSIETVEVGGLSVWHQREQSERPEGPWFATFTDFTDVRNVRLDAVRRTARTRGFSSPDWMDSTNWSEPSTTFAAGGLGIRQANGTFSPGEIPWDVGALPVALGPEHALVAALDAADLHAEPDAVIDGYAHHVLAFTFAAARVRLFLNAPSFLPKAIDVVRARPYDVFWAPWGDVARRVTFGLWTLEPEGVLYPRLWDFSTNQQPDGTIEITRVRFNPPVDRSTFDIPEADRQRLAAGRRLIADTPLGSQERPSHELAPGIVQVPGRWDIVEVKQDDGVVIIEGPLSSSYSVKVIDDAKQRFGGAPIKAVISTSDSWPHIGGLREYVARAIPIYALDLNVPILRRLFAAKFESTPDALAKRPHEPTLRVVAGRTVVGTGSNQLVIYPLRTPSGERQMMVYWPAHHLLYTSDLFTIRGKFIFLPLQVAEAVGAAGREQLQVETAFGMHYDPLPWSTIVAGAAPPARATDASDPPVRSVPH
ncbi:MAG TPA: hypothetical protein VH583_21770 [Vicinamibacterales bacterium]